MEAIGDLDRRGGTGGRALGKCAGAIAANDLNGWKGLQPGGHRRRCAVRQHINRLTAFQIHDQRAIGLPAPARPLVDADDLGRRWRRQRRAPDQAQQRRATGADTQPVQDATAGFAAGGKGEHAHDLGEAVGGWCGGHTAR